jgi:hypothetical protein
MSDTEEIQSKVISARDQLQDTLDEIGNRLNVPKRAKKSYRENPTAWKIGAAVAVAAVGGLVALAIAKRS